jgi:hypothetical protein
VTIEVDADVLDTAMLGSRFMRWRMTLSLAVGLEWHVGESEFLERARSSVTRTFMRRCSNG